MKFNNINKRLMAALSGSVMLTAPLTLTACFSYEYVTAEDGSRMLNPDKMYSYNDVKKLHVINVKTKINEKIYLSYIYYASGVPINYCDVFTGREIIHNNNNGDTITEGVAILSEESVEQYLISYDMLKDSYCVEDLELLLEKIKQDVYSDNNKEFVKAK